MRKIKIIASKKITCIAILLISFISFSQQKEIDSIKKLLKGKLTLSQRALKMKDLAMYYEVVDSTISIKSYDNALDFAKKNKLDYETAVIYQNKSYIYTAIGFYKKSIENLEQALVFLDKVKNNKNPEFRPKIHSVLGNNYRYLSDNKKASLHYLKAISGFENLNLYSHVVNNYYNLANVYKSLNENEKIFECAEKTLLFARKSNEKRDLFIAYYLKSYAYAMANEYKEASKYSKIAKRYYDKTYSFESLTGYHLISGLINMNLNELNEANINFSEGLKIAETNKNVFSITQSKMQLARVLTLQKRFAESEKILKSAEAVIEKTNENLQKDVLLDYYSRLYEESGDYKKALLYYKKYKQLNDSIASSENKHFLSELETKYNIQKKDKNILELEKQQIKQRTFIYSLIGIALGLLIFSFLLYKNYKARKKINDQEIIQLHQEKKIDATQNMIQGEEQERTRLARDLHDGLGGMLTGVKFQLNSMKGNVILSEENAGTFTKSISQIDNAIAEMRRVAHNMMPEALLKFGLDETLRSYCDSVSQNSELTVSYQSFGMEERLEQTNEIVLYRIVQELLNNTIKHANATKSNIQLTRNDNLISLTVEDNGKGFDVNTEQIASKLAMTGIGLSNINHRVEYLNGKMDIQSDSKGTSTHIEFEIT
ncbi:tetratricopeptide repeat protein [Flavobacterium sp.]|uniref:tetratricopeptide repeat-containing sensor histidine kinase n=1 Tax=Flavobacterium sp. TaxID=239 RepID=UPI00286C1003|nr:tetratricopeptide repeat protein [Flavobacterium sp.]